MADLARIARLSGWLYRAAILLGFALPLAALAAVVQGWADPGTLTARFPALPAHTAITPAQGALAGGLALLTILPLITAILAMTRLFARYARAEILSDACAGDILSIGRAMVLLALATVFVPMLQLLVLSWYAPPGQRLLQIGLDGGTLGFLLAAGLLSVIGWVMREAARIKAENEGFV